MNSGFVQVLACLFTTINGMFIASFTMYMKIFSYKRYSMRIVLGLVLIMVTSSAGCDSTNNDVSFVDDAIEDAESCWTELESISLWGEQCSAEFDDMVDYLSDCSSGKNFASSIRQISPCDGSLRVDLSYGTHGYTCYYDETSKQLEGAMWWDDIPHDCAKVGAMYAGELKDCPIDPAILDLQCPADEDKNFMFGSREAMDLEVELK